MKNAFRPHWFASVFAALLTVQAPFVRAEIVSTEEMTTQNQADAERAKVRSFLERANVMERLQAMGVDGVAAKDRVAALSQEEIHALAQRIDSMPAGAALGTTDLILILLVVILVAVII